MESLAYLHSAVAYESQEPVSKLQVEWQGLSNSALPLAPSLMAVALMLSTATSSLAASGIVKTGSGGPLNVRDRPNGTVISTVPDGSQVELTGNEQSGFLELADGTWVNKQFIQVAQSGTTSPSAAPNAASPGAASSTTGAKTGVVKTGGSPLNVRSQPNGDVISTVPDGTTLQLTGEEQAGFLKQTDGTWVDKQYVQVGADTASPIASPAAPSVTPAVPSATPIKPVASASPTTPAAPITPAPSASPIKPAPAPSATAKTGIVQTNGQPLNVRDRPNGNLVGTLPNGAKLQFTGKEQNGFLERADGTWVAKQFIVFQDTAAPSPAPSASPSPAPSPAPGSGQVSTIRTNGGPLNVRRSPGGAVIGSIANGSRVELTGRNVGGWLERTNGTWVSARWVAASGTNPGTGTPPTGSDRSTGTVQTNGSPLLVRSSPGGSIVGSIANGSRIELTGRKSGSWLERPNGTWVAASWVKLSDSTTPNPSPGNPPPTGSDRSTGVIRTNGGYLNVRSSPSGSVVGSLANGTQVELTGRKSGNWLERTNGTWVSATWVSASGTTAPGNPSPPQGSDRTVGTIRTNGNYLNVRSSPGGAVIDSLPNGTRVELTGRKSSGWVQLSRGGWVSSQWVKQ